MMIDATQYIRVQERSTDPDETMKRLRQMEEFYYGTELKKIDADVSPASYAYSTAPTWVNPVYGRQVWSFLNYDQNVFAVLPKEPWLQSGWRMLTAAAQAWTHAGAELTGGIDRGDALPDTIAPTMVVNANQPKEIIHTWGVLEIRQFLSSIDDSVSIAPAMRAEMGLEHASIINTMLIQSGEYIAANLGAAWAGTDNFESLDRIVSSDAEEDAVGGAQTTAYDAWMKYGVLAVDRDTGTTYDSVVVAPGGSLGTDGDLTIASMDSVWRQIKDLGGSPDLGITGADFIIALSEILEPERRFVGEAEVMPTFGGVRGLAPGVEGAFTVSTFRSIPLITSPNVRCTDVTSGDTISKLFMLDSSFVRIKVAAPTRYMETPSNYVSYVAQDALRIEGAYLTVGELLAYRFNTLGKLRDIQ